MSYDNKIQNLKNELDIKVNQAYKIICQINEIQDKIELEYLNKKAGE